MSTYCVSATPLGSGEYTDQQENKVPVLRELTFQHNIIARV